MRDREPIVKGKTFALKYPLYKDRQEKVPAGTLVQVLYRHKCEILLRALDFGKGHYLVRVDVHEVLEALGLKSQRRAA